MALIAIAAAAVVTIDDLPAVVGEPSDPLDWVLVVLIACGVVAMMQGKDVDCRDRGDRCGRFRHDRVVPAARRHGRGYHPAARGDPDRVRHGSVAAPFAHHVREDSPRKHVIPLLVAGGAGLATTLGVWALTGRREMSPASEYFLTEGYNETGGTNLPTPSWSTSVPWIRWASSRCWALPASPSPPYCERASPARTLRGHPGPLAADRCADNTVLGARGRQTVGADHRGGFRSCCCAVTMSPAVFLLPRWWVAPDSPWPTSRRPRTVRPEYRCRISCSSVWGVAVGVGTGVLGLSRWLVPATAAPGDLRLPDHHRARV